MVTYNVINQPGIYVAVMEEVVPWLCHHSKVPLLVHPQDQHM
jgi:hypothetical protein